MCHNIVDGTGESLTKGAPREALHLLRRGPAVQRLKLDVVVQEYSGGGRVNESRSGGRYLESHSSALL